MTNKQLVLLPIFIMATFALLLQMRDGRLSINNIIDYQPDAKIRKRLLEFDPFVNRWRRKFDQRGGYLFFKHIRKAGEKTYDAQSQSTESRAC